ncbi:cystathionine gamma-synthase family protein [Allopontixanthobacter sediminis]|uniref:Cystathionine gamma-synthase family protein n=1 Tax=Allopontixanthobacter sediminis TaxID=1689985 RepID=A0A845B1Y5_9SPHN|nr:cystathionine gamma-synthase family protein [Allopontixanthobacter sediminis]MXP45733.1 cystathionine gamma-synthase family protein [Allopontixanthobacter sediminis]
MTDATDAVTTPTPRRKPKPEITTIGGRPLKPSTLMMGHGYDPALSEGSLKAPIFLTSTFAFENAAAGKRHFEGITGKRPGGAEGLVYSRFNGPNQEILEDRLSIWDGAEDALSFSSGMTAITVMMLAYCNAGDVIVHSGPLYAATEGFVAKVLSKFGITYVDFPAGATREEMDAVLAKAKSQADEHGGKVAMIYLESPANPTNALVDVEAMSAARDAAFDADGPPIAIDNTFLGPLWQRPLDQGADIVVYSLTKYVGGHSDLVAGSIAGAKKWMDPVRALRNTMGGICDPNTAWMLLRSLETVELRMQRAGENAAKVCAFLRDHPKVEGLGYLGFISDPRQQDIYNRHCLGAGSTFSLFIKGGEAEAFRFLDSMTIAKLAVSLGGTETLASLPAAMTHLSVPDERKAQLGITDNLVRISIGIEDPDDLIADFDQALAKV